MFFEFSMQDIFFAAGLALAVTWTINIIIKMFKTIINRSTEFDYSPRNRDSVMEKCNSLFPTDSLRFNNEIFRRGMQIRICTSRNKLLEGCFIGVNDDNMICIMTPRRVVAQELDMINDIEML
jgi:hypothetical protein